MLTWPNTLPLPQPDGYTLTPVDVTSRTQMGDGYFRTRRRALVAPYSVTANFRVDADQMEILRNFYEFAVRQGSDTFLMPIFIDGAYRTRQVAFQGAPKFDYETFIFWKATVAMAMPSGIATTLYRELSSISADANVSRVLGVMLTDFRIKHVDVFVRTAPNSGTSDTLDVGFTGSTDCFVSGLDIHSAGYTRVAVGHTAAGVSLDTLITAGGGHTLRCQWHSTGTAATDVDVLVMLPFLDV